MTRILAEQRWCRDYILDRKGDDVAGARMGLADWVMEEVLEQDSYDTFLQRKSQNNSLAGFPPLWIPDFLFPFQKAVVEWAIRKGRAAIFADCGLGKTPMQLVWAENVVRKTAKPVLILTPLAVAQQTVREAAKFDIDCRRTSGETSHSSNILVTNYEKIHHFSPDDFSGVVCDESSAIKSFDGKRRAQVTEFLRTIKYRLLCTATAAPNDYVELGTSSEALGEMGHMDMLSRFFRNDQNTCDTKLLKRRPPPAYGGPRSAGWRFKGHAEQPFWRFVAFWARAGRKPSDFGNFSDDSFALQPLMQNEHIVKTRTLAPGMLFALPASNMREERDERRRTIQERCEKVAELVGGSKDPAVVWCHLNKEGDLLERLIGDGRQIAGSTPDEEKEELYEAFGLGQLRVLAIKDRIGAWGLNWQHCAHVVRFATHSYEAHYQAIRRCWRFGQKRPVVVDLVMTEGERGIAVNLQRKAEAADRMFTELVRHMNTAIRLDSSIRFQEAVEVPIWAA